MVTGSGSLLELGKDIELCKCFLLPFPKKKLHGSRGTLQVNLGKKIQKTKNKKRNKTHTQEVKELGGQEAHGESYPGSWSQELFGEGEGDEAGWMLVNFW